ncbi:YqgE/AlgH family protein, partial [Streptomyces sp. NPDC059552]|uniref:YqgE/AlgH family protein n=1 Tax=Streptomyces sp. NPDC059552 TaxID=3346862 RepID=UPI0036756ADE
MTEVSSLTGRLLVATPALADPNFDRAVVLLLDHDEQGSLGVVLNRPAPRGGRGGRAARARPARGPPVGFARGGAGAGTAPGAAGLA